MRLLTVNRIRINVMRRSAYVPCLRIRTLLAGGVSTPVRTCRSPPTGFAPTLMIFWACRHQMKPVRFLSQKTAGSDRAQL